MIGISTITADTAGDMILMESSESILEDFEARVSVSATLDGGGIISHYGFSESDNRLEIKADLNTAEIEKLKAIFKTYTYLNISTSKGIFKGAISRLFPNDGLVEMTILIEEKYA